MRLAVFAITTPAALTLLLLITKSCYRIFLALGLALRASFYQISTILEIVLVVFIVVARFLTGALRTGLLIVVKFIVNYFIVLITSFFTTLIAFN